jgi:hypothetical protein
MKDPMNYVYALIIVSVFAVVFFVGKLLEYFSL